MKGMTYDKSGTQVFVNHDNTHNIAATDKSDNLNKSTSTVKNMMRIVYLKKKKIYATRHRILRKKAMKIIKRKMHFILKMFTKHNNDKNLENYDSKNKRKR